MCVCMCVCVGCHLALSLVCLTVAAPDLCGRLTGLLNLAAISNCSCSKPLQDEPDKEKKNTKELSYLIERHK